MSKIDFRYLIPENIFNELIELSKKGKDGGKIMSKKDGNEYYRMQAGWLFADRKNNFAIIKGYEVTKDNSESHVRPKSWMRMKKHKLYHMRKLKEDRDLDIVYQFHTHPDGIEELHDVDLKILNYLTTGVMIVITPTNVLGWYFDKRETKKPFIDKMVFEIINE